MIFAVLDRRLMQL